MRKNRPGKHDAYILANYGCKTAKEMAEECHAWCETIYKSCRRLKVPLLKAAKGNHGKTKKDFTIMDNYIREHMTSKTNQQIADDLGVKIYIVQNRKTAMREKESYVKPVEMNLQNSNGYFEMSNVCLITGFKYDKYFRSA